MFGTSNSVGVAFKFVHYVWLLGIAAAGLAVVGGGCAHSGASPAAGPVRVPLSYTPEHAKDSIRSYPTTIPQTKIYVGQFQDKRDRKDAIGVNSEHDTTVTILAGSDPVDFFRQTLATQLRRAGLNVVDDASQADRTINGDLLHFWVDESSNYEAEIEAAIRVVDKSGAVKWEGQESGHGKNFGRSLNPENYRQALSDAMVRLTYENLLTNPDFQNALK